MLTLTQCIEAANDLQSRRRSSMPILPDNPTREQLIDWLCWDDRNGCYSDEDCIAEWGEPMTFDETIEHFTTIIESMVLGFIYTLGSNQ